MNEKEKAKELVDKYVIMFYDIANPFELAKQCALVCVDEIINAITENCCSAENCDCVNEKYWQGVKIELL